MFSDLADALEDAKERGYTNVFEVEDGCLFCANLDSSFTVDELTIVDSYQFDMGTNPSDDNSLYLIDSNSGVKGYLITGYSSHVDREKASFLDRLLDKGGPTAG